MFAGYRPNAVCVQWTSAKVVIADHVWHLTVNDVCRCKNKPVGNVIGGRYMEKENRDLKILGIWRISWLALCRRDLALAEIRSSPSFGSK